ncbi:cytochrome b5-like [Mercurialis annua]|uniref:cytochrome b5-like n=1 Tax=Mercurialis annua TaxID=3986 RepID=UPI00215E9932|nr:cytochrome b5-like [Mercurialis annua]
MASERKLYSFDDLLKHKDRDDCWLLIHGKIYDVTSFMEEHPGGDEVLLAATEKDATDDYEDIGHSEEAKEMMDKYCIGDMDMKSLPPPGFVRYRPPQDHPKAPQGSFLVKLLQLLLPLIFLGAALAYRSVTKKE